MKISEMQKIIEQIFFDFEIIASEFVALDTRFYLERILIIWGQYVKKQSQDFRYYYNWNFWADFLSEWSKNKTQLLPCIFRSFSDPVTCRLSTSVLTRGFLGI